MVLFKVPGWSIPTAPIQEDSPRTFKKRKLSSTNQSEGLDFNKQLKKLSHEQPATSKSSQKSQVYGKKVTEEKPKDTPGPSSVTGVIGRKKKKREKHVHALPNQADPVIPLTDLQRRMKQTLHGARFRLINETFYKAESQEARRMMQQDPNMFEEYHVGFRHQVLSWPTNPVDHYIEKFSSYTHKPVIADLGCGDAALAKQLLPRGISVISFDLVSDNAFVVATDICDQVPLPGSEGTSMTPSMGEGQVIDAVVCALSLMGTNWVASIREAWRILKAKGQLHIAEVTSRFTDTEQFVALITSIGFRFKSKDDSNTHFMLFEFSKVPRQAKSDKEWSKLISKGSVLKPCEYKRR